MEQIKVVNQGNAEQAINFDEKRLHRLLSQYLQDEDVIVYGDEVERSVGQIVEKLMERGLDNDNATDIEEFFVDLLVHGSEFAYMLGVKSGARIMKTLLA